MLLFVPITAGAQTGGSEPRPLRKTDLIRLLTDSSMSPAQVAAQVGKSCLAFTPTARDRANLLALGADTAVFARIDACSRARAAAARPPADPPPTPAAPVTPPAPVVGARLVAVPLVSRVQAVAGATALVGVSLKRGNDPVAGARLVLLGSARVSGGGDGGVDAVAVTDARGLAQFRFPAGSRTGTFRLGVMVDGDSLATPVEVQLTIVAPPPAPPPAPVVAAAPQPAPERTGFALGMAQRGRVGDAARLPLVFEVRDSTGRAISGVVVELSVMNGRVSGAQLTTDSLGQVRTPVVFGERAGVPTVVSARVGPIVREATLYPIAAPPSRLVVLLGGNALVSQVVLLANKAAQLRIFCRDRFGNAVPLSALRASVGDDRVVRVTEVTFDSLGGAVTVQAGKAGATNLVIQGSGLRADFSALVR
ncbi:MAG TPA: Ig-like domain-containing protein [Burkholderiales bacterium]|nr:Ig-like domain-containing protein [Burkholderiales bacterium]